jgi:hypothetical protein
MGAARLTGSFVIDPPLKCAWTCCQFARSSPRAIRWRASATHLPTRSVLVGQMPRRGGALHCLQQKYTASSLCHSSGQTGLWLAFINDWCVSRRMLIWCGRQPQILSSIASSGVGRREGNLVPNFRPTCSLPHRSFFLSRCSFHFSLRRDLEASPPAAIEKLPGATLRNLARHGLVSNQDIHRCSLTPPPASMPF